MMCSPTQTQNQGRARKARLWVGVPGSSTPEANPQEVDKALAFTRGTSGREDWVEETALLALCRISSLPASPTHCPSFLSPREKAAGTLLSLSLGLLHEALSQLLQEGFLAQSWPLLPAFQGLGLATLLLPCRMVWLN